MIFKDGRKSGTMVCPDYRDFATHGIEINSPSLSVDNFPSGIQWGLLQF
tara:strand:+ start:840 stop:986 length:147 start_codon:yes stop_codon:yes gene_type:complete